MTATLATGHVAVAGPALKRRWWLASAAFCGLGMLTKGPVALVLCALPLCTFQALDPRMARPSRRSWMAFLALAFGIAGPWYLAVALIDPGFLHYFFWKHNIVRFVAPFDHAEPFWFHLPGLLLGMLPWTLLLPDLVRHLCRRSRRTAQRRPAALGFFLLAGLWGLLFFSLSGCKRTVYILPVLPPLALALGSYLDLILPRKPVLLPGTALFRRGSRLAHLGTLLVLAFAALGSLAGIQAQLLPPVSGGALAVTAGSCFWALWQQRWHRTRQVSWAGCAGATFLLLFAALHQLQPGYARRFSLRSKFSRIAPSPLPWPAIHVSGIRSASI